MLGDDAKPSLVVRAHAPRRGVILIAALTLVGIFLLYVVYELGRYDAGYDRLAVAQERAEHEVDIERMEKSNRQLRTRLAELDRSEEHTSELQSQFHLVCRLLLEKKNRKR